MICDLEKKMKQNDKNVVEKAINEELEICYSYFGYVHN